MSDLKDASTSSTVAHRRASLRRSELGAGWKILLPEIAVFDDHVRRRHWERVDGTWRRGTGIPTSQYSTGTGSEISASAKNLNASPRELCPP